MAVPTRDRTRTGPAPRTTVRTTARATRAPTAPRAPDPRGGAAASRRPRPVPSRREIPVPPAGPGTVGRDRERRGSDAIPTSGGARDDRRDGGHGDQRGDR